MAQHLFTDQEIRAILAAINVSAEKIRQFQEQADRFAAARPTLGDNRFEVSSGFGQKTQRGYVDVRMGSVREQLEPKKAIEIAGMLYQAAEAAISDEIVLKLLDAIGAPNDPAMRGAVLLQLRELRQGTRGVSYPQ